jgi:hypothetical protein
LNENTLQIIAILKLVWVAVFAGLYGFGGISNKWLRRFVGPLWIGIGIYVFSALFSSGLHSFRYSYLIYPLLLCASLHIGYGADTLITKFRKRFFYGLALGVSALPLAIFSGLWILFGVHCLLCLLASVCLGVVSGAGNARNEETLIAALSTVCVLFLI